MTDKKVDVAIVGVTGVVGEAMLSILEQRKFPVGKIHVLASQRSAGKRVPFGEKHLVVKDLAEFDFSQVQVALFSAGAAVSAEYIPKAVDAGCICIDNTSQFRYDDEIPLVVPEVNPERIADYRQRGIIANPNCSTIQLLVALNPLHTAVGIERINVCTYQSVSGAGHKAIEELAGQTARLLNGQSIKPHVFPKQIAFNVLPQIDRFMENGYTREEMKMVWETRKILGDESIQVNPTAVRVPVFFGHSAAVHIETREKISAKQARDLLLNSPGIELVDESDDGGYPTPVTESAGRDGTFVGRIREDISHPRGLNLWIVSDNVRKGAALNTIQIAEILEKDYL
ncbi:aspartate-semialdehyde dehydrogenase [Sedimenticola sp.]|uniref:aspartate-semialdehyde dehydrogenase n=1 Tax=Sedimenticola sp. TaxID=1940285 RepID=UPI002582B138|nr:aspartate-semialdehyde dehydrogenase [Sedimenticola sp.]MCW8905456.1 aspartate-semialdehyde dehydrogenase [Sedimenticola sp.]